MAKKETFNQKVEPIFKEKADFKERSQNAIKEVMAVLEKYQVAFLPRIDYKPNGESHVVVALFEATPQDGNTA